MVVLLLVTAGCGSSRLSERSAAFQHAAAIAEAMAEMRAAEAPQLERWLREQVEIASQDVRRSIDPLTFDAYLAVTPPEKIDPELATRSFLVVLTGIPTYADEVERAAALRHLATTELLLGRAAPGGSVDERVDAAVRWWLEQDLVPATAANERLVTHLSRLSEARKNYVSQTSPTGLDARGEVLVRYGEPARRRQIDLQDAWLIRQFQYEGIPVSGNDLPAGEFWSYEHVYDGGIYLFVEGRRADGYHVGTVNDLLPRQLRHRGVTGSARGGSMAFAALRLLRLAYSQLALYHPSYSARYETVSNYVGWQEERVIGDRGGSQGTYMVGRQAATTTLSSVITRNDREDRRIVERRERVMPEEFSPSGIRALPVAGRAVRFLGADRSTRVSLYWSVAPEHPTTACHPAGGELEHTWHSRVVRYSPLLYQAEVLEDQVVTGSALGVQRVDLTLPAGITDLSLQIDHTATAQAATGQTRQVTCTGVVRSGALAPLETAGHALALSDLLPFVVDDVVETRERLSSSFSVGGLEPLLQDDLSGEPAVGIYFEVYSLLDLGDEYVLDYEVAKRTHGGFLQRGRSQSSAYQSARRAAGDRLPAAFLIDRAEWQGADEIDVIVTVTDLESGREIRRTLTFLVGG